MRTNIDIDDELMTMVMRTGEFKTKREAVEAGLRAIIRRKAYQDVRALRGKIQWDDSDNPDPPWEVTGQPTRAPLAKARTPRPAATKAPA